MICTFCVDNVLGSDLEWDRHHQTLDVFLKSAGEGCVFCRQLAKDVDGLQNSWDKTKPIYFWTRRRASRGRGSYDPVSLTFRPVSELRDAQGKLLPDRTFYLIPSEDLRQIPAPDRIGPRTDSHEVWSQITKWVADCDQHHEKCVRKHRDQNFVPTRLLDIGLPQSKWPPDFVRVVNTKDEGTSGRYATLSHCWGLKDFVKLTEATKSEFMKSGGGVPWTEIETNKNFADAILVARKLNVRYIWIDSLCIIQDKISPDFRLEAPLMHRVYRNSYCNIAASDSEDKDGGLFPPKEAPPRDTTVMVPPQYTPTCSSPTFGTRTWAVLMHDMWQEQVLSKVLYTRGWVFQERLLAPRLIHFSRAQVFFDCCTLTASETLPSGLPLLLDGAARVDRQWRERLQQPTVFVPMGGDHSLEQLWRSAVAFYTQCSLTNGADKLLAIWGVAKLVRDALHEEFGAGLWAEQLPEQLAWRVVATTRMEKGFGRPKEQLEFPSWSWASVKGEVKVGGRILAEPRCYVVTGHDGESVRFTVEEPLYGRVDGKKHGGQEDLVEFMKRSMSAWETREREGFVIPGPGSLHRQHGGQSARNNMPVLVKPGTIAIMGHIVRGSLERPKGSGKWELKVEGLDDNGRFEAFPDEILLKEEETAECDFVVLVAYSGKEGYESLQEEDLAGAVCSGVGIMVEHVNHANYRRIGSLTFSRLSFKSWHELRRRCCQRERGGQGFSDLHNLTEGQKFWLQ